jgi:hypothetical protein
MVAITQYLVHEWSFFSHMGNPDPFNTIEMDMLFVDSSGHEMAVPAFWSGGQVWKVRFSLSRPGHYTYRTRCSDVDNYNLHNVTGSFDVLPYDGPNPLYHHGPVRVATDQRHFEFEDGTPFFWLADTWWMGLCKRLDWPRGFQTLALDRAEKGFNVIQIVAGLYPDMDGFDDRGANEAGFPWEPGYKQIRPEYFVYMDRRIQYLVDVGLMPCIVGCWGYYLRVMGIDKIKQHWRYLIARYGAYPVFWCLAGEQTMPFYLSADKAADTAYLKEGWSTVARYVREIDPYHRLVTVHPGTDGREQMSLPDLIDFEMLQTGHSDRQSLPNTVESMRRAIARQPTMPVIDAEVCYEGIGEACRQEVQRLMFWVCILHGAAGHTYGANGIWQVNTKTAPYGPSPHGLAWGNTPWDEAAQLPGSRQLGISKKLVERYAWWRFECHPEWVEPHWSQENYFGAYAAGIPGEVRFIFWPSTFTSGVLKHIEKDITYHATLFNPVNGEILDLGIVERDEVGDWWLPVGHGEWHVMPVFQDWILIMEKDKD